MDKYGLIGKSIDYSFSKEFFRKKFSSEGILATYQNFHLPEISEVETLLKNKKHLKGLNVTIPYKEKILPYLDEISPEAQKIGAVNTIEIHQGKLIGHNTDSIGFRKAIAPLLKKQHQHALILGTGGASKAIAHGLEILDIQFKFVSRKPIKNHYSYDQLSEAIMQQHLLLINCTPLGTFPHTDESPAIPYNYISKQHLLFDLTYNPPLTTFLAKGKKQGAQTSNGQKMLEFQAEKAWSIWNNSLLLGE